MYVQLGTTQVLDGFDLIIRLFQSQYYIIRADKFFSAVGHLS